MIRALTFGSVAEAYERYRPGYPDAVVEEVLAYAGRPSRPRWRSARAPARRRGCSRATASG